MKNLCSLLLIFSATAFQIQTISQTPTPLEVEFEDFINQVNRPVGIEHPGDERLFILEQHTGIIKIYDLEGNFISNFIDLNNISTANEQGLLGLAFHPGYSENGRFFVNYTESSGDTRISEFQVSSDPNIADEESEIVILEISQPFNNHNGGGIEFGPDGYLYIGTGDGGSAGDPQNNAQSTDELLGKMLRIDVDSGDPYGIPDDNPFIDDETTLDEIWAIGLRNPWRYSFDSETGDLWIADVGQNLWEEIHFEPASSAGGLNYGWRCYEATHPYNLDGCDGMYTDPIAEFSHSSGFCSITGGLIYRGDPYPRLQGQYFFTDYCQGYIYGLKETEEGEFEQTTLNDDGHFGYVAFGVDIDGQLYIADLTGNKVLKIVDPCGTFEAEIDLNEDDVLEASEGSEYYWYLDGELVPDENNSTFEPDQNGEVYAVVENSAGCALQSNTFDWTFSNLTQLQRPQIKLYPNPASDVIRVQGLPSNALVEIYNTLGQKIEATSQSFEKGEMTIGISDFKTGNYILRVKSEGEVINKNFQKK